MIRGKLQKLIQEATKRLGFEVKGINLEHPENAKHGDYSTSVALVLAKELGKNSREVAEQIVSNFDVRASDFISKVEVAGAGFINFFVSQDYLIQELKSVLKQKDKYGAGRQKKKIIVEYSSPNIAKPFGIGHLRSTIIGQAIYNLYKFLGNTCTGINHLGDWGTPHGMILYQLQEKELDPKDLTMQDLENLYVEFHQTLENFKGTPKGDVLLKEAKEQFKKLEQGDKKIRKLWEQIKAMSLKEFDRIYNLLGVKIDHAIGESFYEDKMADVLKEIEQKKLSEKSEGALIFPFKNLPPAMLLKSDGVTTYFTRDLAAMKYRLNRWKPWVIIIETGTEQTLHFKQVFEATKLLGWIPSQQLVHVAHGLYRTKEGKFSTRKGQTIHLEEVLNEAIERARKIIEESETGRGLSEKEKAEVAKVVGIGGIKYNDLSQHPLGDIVFDWDKILNLKGNSASYLQYTHARCRSILRKSEIRNSKFEINSKFEFSGEEMAILQILYKFPEVVREAAEKFSPNLLCNFAFELAQAYNVFYNTHRVLEADTKEQKQFRLLLTATVAQLIKNCLSLLGIQSPERM